MPARYLGKSLEEAMRESLRELLGGDPEALKLAYRLLDAYVNGGRRGVRKLVAGVLEVEAHEGQA